LSKNFKDFYFLLILLFSGGATAFYNSKIGVITLFTLNLVLLWHYRIPIRKSFKIAVGVWLFYTLVTTIAHSFFAEFFTLRHLNYLLSAYVIIMLFKFELFERFEKFISYFALVSLVFFIWQLISPGSLISACRVFDISGEMDRASVEYYNVLFYTVETFSGGINYRNYGFAFEPGVFAVYLSIAIYFNIMRCRFIIKGNWRLLTLFAALLTTQSTTGILALGTLGSYLSLVELKGIKKYIFTIAIVSCFLISFFSIDFMYHKIINLFETGQDFEHLINSAAQSGGAYSAGRFGGYD